MARTPVDLARELSKVHDAVKAATAQLVHTGEANALLHMAAQVRHNPLTVAMQQADDDLARIIRELEEES